MSFPSQTEGGCGSPPPQGRHLEGGFWFAVLLNFKHIFLYLAPAYFVYLLKYYCFSTRPTPQFRPCNFIKLGGVVLGVFLASFGPFIWMVRISTRRCLLLLRNY